MNHSQTSLLEIPAFTGKELSIIGQELAIESADAKVEKWSELAYALLLEYVALHGAGYRFQGEDARFYCEAKGLQEPPSKRAYGGLIRKMAGKGLIKRVGYDAVMNSKAHATPSTVWEII